jgi:aminomethyltransferase
MVDFAGWSMPLRYTSETAEHHAVRRAAGLFDVSHMGQIVVAGPQAGAALDHALVGDMSGLAVGRARYTMICATDGGVMDDLVVYHLDHLRYLVLANASNTSTVLCALEDRSRDLAAEVADLTEDYALLALQGPRSAEILSPLVSEDLSTLRYYSFAQVLVAEQPVLLARTGYTGEDGFELLVAPHLAEDVWGALLEAGGPVGLLPAGLACRDTLRLEAGMPLHGHELHLGVTPYEAGLGRVVKLDKPGDFIGREALARRAATGPLASLVGLASVGAGRVARHGSEVLAAGPDLGARSPKIVGTVTSGAPSPTLGRPIAMASVTPGCVEVGSVVQVDIRGRPEPFEVVSLPFYCRER